MKGDNRIQESGEKKVRGEMRKVIIKSPLLEIWDVVNTKLRRAEERG